MEEEKPIKKKEVKNLGKVAKQKNLDFFAQQKIKVIQKSRALERRLFCPSGPFAWQQPVRSRGREAGELCERECCEDTRSR